VGDDFVELKRSKKKEHDSILTAEDV
jgi:hypothetical protein